MRRSGVRGPGAIALGLAVAMLGAVGARGDEVYIVAPIEDLTVVEGTLPGQPGGDVLRNVRWQDWPHQMARAVLDGEGEAYIDGTGQGRVRDPLNQARTVAIRLPGPRDEVTGRLYLPDPNEGPDGQFIRIVRFRLTPKASADAKARFQTIKADHYRALLQQNFPGAAWFRHQVREAGDPGNAPFQRGIVEMGVARTYSLFGGGRAIRENLQLDRSLLERPAPGVAAGRVPLDQITGISVAEIDWTERIAGKSPELDPLARAIPADQHALFVPSLKAAVAMVDQAKRWGGLPVLGMASGTSTDEGTLASYERQLGFGLADLGRLEDLQTIRSIALTGSDPYFVEGTDVAVLFETTDPASLLELIRVKINSLRNVEPAANEVRGVATFGAVGEGRRVSTIAAAVGSVVILSNSPVQIDRVIAAAKGEAPTLAELPEYTFFRDRYARGDSGELALMVLSDATIRRWCGPRWRIGASRRSRAGAWLSEIQATNLEAIVRGSTPRADRIDAAAGGVDLGELAWGQPGVISRTYGSVEFLTPIAELPIDDATEPEARAYEQWRDGYQRNWRGVFDPIAVRISSQSRTLSADLTVMPLIASTDYRPFLELVGAAKIGPRSGDPHPEALVHVAMAIDRQSTLFRQGNDLSTTLIGVPKAVGLSWLGSSVALYADDDPFWDDLAKAEDASKFLGDRWQDLPIAATAEVTDPAKLALFLTALRAYQQQTAPDLLSWETVKHGDRSFVRISPREGVGPAGTELKLYYAATPTALTISLSETVIRRALDRQSAPPAAGEEAEPWAGESLAFRATNKGIGVLGRASNESYRDQLRRQSWSNLPILNEWHRLFPDEDPVAVHEAAWGERPVCPGGGAYVWDETWQTMKSTAFGHPGDPIPGPELPAPLANVGRVDAGVSFGDGGLRGRVSVEERPEP